MTSNRRVKIFLACATFACALSLSPSAMAEPQPQDSFFSRLFSWGQTNRPVQRVADVPARDAASRPCPQCKTFVFGLAF